MVGLVPGPRSGAIGRCLPWPGSPCHDRTNRSLLIKEHAMRDSLLVRPTGLSCVVGALILVPADIVQAVDFAGPGHPDFPLRNTLGTSAI
jgi:hypothetical protein